MKEIRAHPICVSVIAVIMLMLCLALVHPVKIAMIIFGAMLLFYVVFLTFLGNCLEMGVFSIVVAVIVTQLFGVIDAWKTRKEKKRKDKVEQTAAPLPPAPAGPSEGAR